MVWRARLPICALIVFSMRNLPTFGRDTIRKFCSDVSARKKLAARDYEDFLQVRTCVRSDIATY